MKVGEVVSVNIGAATVAGAKIVEIDTENNLATLVIPATKVVMSYKTELDTTPNQSPTSDTEHAILGVEPKASETLETPAADTAISEGVVTTPSVEAAPVEAAPVEVETPNAE